MRKTHDLAVVTGTYEKNGETKRRYQNVGVVLEGDHGPMILLDKHFNPAGIEGKDGRIVVSMFEPRDEQKSAQNYGGQAAQEPERDLDDEVPFVTNAGMR